jgi:hypothetical protein
MSTGECELCGETFEIGVDSDPFTSVSVSHHDDTREDFAESLCQDCGDELLADLYEEVSN